MAHALAVLVLAVLVLAVWLAVLAVCWHTRHTALVLRALVLRGQRPAPWCCAASGQRPAASGPAALQPCSPAALQPCSPMPGVAGPSG